ncbi:PREDICTED: uncharacterized protein LOC108364719 [Rhagoletis zephyria]|uniref:uncharacterized protein LOC108364719 n=1 Tax=Rhagoletis zephyria TaxID=28612 RepID=UPI00081157AB|nr:PREDICTED: uncharacterized protein LOC108364719 [Rhagoletis zephyria]
MKGAGSTESKQPWDDTNDALYLQHLKNQVSDEDDTKEKVERKVACADKVPMFEDNELKGVLKNKTKRSAGGCDQITYEMLRSLPETATKNLLTALNDAFTKCEINDSWRKVRIVPIPKANKDLSDYKNFRPISLISVLVKSINLMIKGRLEGFLNDKNIYPERSYAYRKGKSAAMCINDFLHKVASLKHAGKKAVVLTLDINNAYNCVTLGKLQSLLGNFEIPDTYIKWIIDFFGKRILHLGKESIIIEDGLPQGSCLSPLLFNLYTKELHSIGDSGTDIYQFADDFLILSHGSNCDIVRQNLEQKAKQFYDICTKLNLSFNVQKTKLMYIAKSNRQDVQIKINEIPIEQVRQIKFIGRTINSSLTVGPHFQRLVNDTKKNANFLKCLTPVKTGITPKVAVTLYKSFIRSKVEVARTTAARIPKTINKKIMTFQNATLRRCLGLTPSTPVHTIYVLANELEPLERGKYLTSRELVKIMFDNPTLFNSVKKDFYPESSYSLIYHEFKNTFDKIDTDCTFQKSVGMTVLAKPELRKRDTTKEQFKAEYNQKIDFYKNNKFSIFATDASGGETAMGCGVYNVTHNQKFFFKINFKTSSAFAEAWAIAKAVDIAVEDGLKNIAIFTDSLVACNWIEKEKSNNYIVARIHKRLSEGGINCVLTWTPSHVGIQINETVDEMAKTALEVGAPLNVSLTPEEAIRKINEELRKNWNDRYRQTAKEKGKLFAEYFPEITSDPWYIKSKMEARDIKTINRLLTGHTYDRVYLHKIGASESDRCQSCQATDNYIHAIFECGKHNSIREKYDIFNEFENLHHILKKRDTRALIELCKFIREAEISI